MEPRGSRSEEASELIYLRLWGYNPSTADKPFEGDSYTTPCEKNPEARLVAMLIETTREQIIPESWLCCELVDQRP